MRYTKFLSIIALSIGAFAILGCESHQPISSQDQPVMMTRLPADQPRVGYITDEMQRFDAGIGDTTLAIGGGGNDN